MRVTLNGIKRCGGLPNWKGRHPWYCRKVRIWSQEHCAWWREKAQGYTDKEAEAGTWFFIDAWEMVKSLGPEKRIVLYAI